MKNIYIFILTISMLAFTCTTCTVLAEEAEESAAEIITTTYPYVTVPSSDEATPNENTTETFDAASISPPEVPDIEPELEEAANGFIKPFTEYSPTDIFTFLILLIKIFENVIKLFVHKWGFGGY